jgi:transcriptional regulator with XRE-family HTH domain
MLGEIFRAATTLFLADIEPSRRLRAAILTTIVGDDTELHAGVAQIHGHDSRDDPVRSLPQHREDNVPRSSDSAPRTAREHAPARTKPVLAASDWPALRTQVKAAIAAKGLTRAQAATEIGFTPGTFARWLSASSRPPGPEALERLRAWVKRPAAGSDQHADPLPALTLVQAERDRLSGYLGLASDRDLRRQFQATRDVIEAAASGAELATEIIGKVRQGLANGAG